MVEINSVKEVIKDYIVKQLISMGESSPAIRLLTPLAKRAIMNNIDSFDKFLKPIADKDGMIDIEGIFDEEMEIINNIDNFDFDKLVEQFVYYTPNGFWNGPLWFLPCLFVVEILFCFINQYLNKYSSLISFFVIPFLGYLCSSYNIYLIFKIDIAFTGLFFYSLGNYISNNRKLTNKFNKKYFFLDIPIFIISIFKFNNLIVQMIIGKYGNYILFLLNAVLGIYLTYQFACIIKDSFIFQTIGRESLIIMALHFIIYIIIFDPIQNKLYINNFWIRNFVTILDVLICLLLCHIIYVFIYNKILLLLEKEKK